MFKDIHNKKFSLHDIKNYILKNKIQYVTCDIFDTLLIRKIYFENFQFYKSALEISKLLKKEFGIEVNPLKILDLRLEAREFIDYKMQRKKIILLGEKVNQDPESSLLDIFTFVLKYLFPSNIYESKIENNLSAILNQVEEIELNLEKKYLNVNFEIYELLKFLKSNNIKVFLVSDMYLSSKNIRNIIEFFKLDNFFDDIFVSSDYKLGKYSGKLFKKIKEKEDKYTFGNSIHLGDNKFSDLLSPATLGVKSFRYVNYFLLLKKKLIKPLQKTILNQIINKNEQTYKKTIADYKKLIKQKYNQNEFLYIQIGLIFASSILFYLDKVYKNSKEYSRKIYMISSEGPIFDRFIKKIDSKIQTFVLKKINRKASLFAYIHKTLTKLNKKEINKKFITNLLLLGEKVDFNGWGVKNVIENSDKIVKKDYLHLINTHAVDVTKLIVNKYASGGNLSIFKEKALLLKDFLDLVKGDREIIICDLGWNGTIQIYLKSILELENIKTKLIGLYFGTTDINYLIGKKLENAYGIVFDELTKVIPKEHIMIEEIWEDIFTSKNKNISNKLILEGISLFFDFYLNNLINIYTPKQSLHYSKEELISLFLGKYKQFNNIYLYNVPHEVETGGYDFKIKVPIVDRNYSILQIYYYLFFKRDLFFNILNSQYWKFGFIKYYKLSWLKYFKFLKKILK